MLHYIREHFYSRDLLKYMNGFEVFIGYVGMKIWKPASSSTNHSISGRGIYSFNIFKPLNMSILF